MVNPPIKAATEAELLAAGVDVILDDRGERPGAMFADWELIGVPHRITIGDKGLKDGVVEYQHRRDTEASGEPIGRSAVQRGSSGDRRRRLCADRCQSVDRIHPV